MRNEIFSTILSTVNNAVENYTVITHEPNWDEWTDFPVLIVQTSNESLTKFVQGVIKRSVEFNIMIVVRSIMKDEQMKSADENVYATIDSLNDTFKGFQFVVGSKNVLCSTGEVTYDRVFSKGDYYVTGAVLKISATFVR